MIENRWKYQYLFLFLLSSQVSFGQSDTLQYLPRLSSMDFNQIDLYGSIRSRLTAYDENVEIQNNGSRIGVALSSFWNKEKEFGVVGRMEWSVNLVSNDFEFNLEANNTSGFAQAQKVSTQNPFGVRLGLVGLDLNQYGKVTIGKQWSVYYDVTRMTDRFFVFGGSSLGTFVNRTDGGTLGTGRAEKALQYRLDVNNWRIGTQVQYRGITGNSSQGDSYGLSVLYQPDSLNVRVGAAFNHAQIAKSTAELLIGASESPQSLAAAISYWEGTRSPSHQSTLYAALAYAWINAAEGVDTDSLTVVYSAHGLEGVVHYQFYDKFSLISGFNFQFPYDANELISAGFNKAQYILGLFYCLTAEGYVYLEGIFDDSNDQFGNKGTNVLTLGLRYNFSLAQERSKLLEYFY